MGLATALWFILPAYVANGGACLIHDKRPVDGGKVAWDGHRLIGDGVTWGGLLSGTTMAIVFSIIQFYFSKTFLDYYPIADASVYDAAMLGALLGFGALFGDMTESFFKRRMGIERGRPLIMLDQWDFLIGALLFASLIYVPPNSDILILFILTPILHFGTNFLSNKVGLKEVPW
ncbi:MAG TPA: CDP-2,3-bis-(O-geranylgeranyl)-sn-glycerol synthase [Candidatus Methanofastidiosa archaeon]|nr:CDP-2,3-bis-(O-geranylgeranyl)-sn-glycerol synthase [Candidatus Methanofastidiosa archaeon]